MILIRSEYAYPLPECDHDGALCQYPDGTTQCWRCWSHEHSLIRGVRVKPTPLCRCGTVIRNEEYSLCFRCRHATVKVPA